MASKASSYSGVGFVGLLTLIFITLRLIPDGDGHVIDWSWWWVLSPLWITAGLIALFVLFVMALFGRR